LVLVRVVAAAAVLLSGCFYIDPIVDAPRVFVTWPSGAVHGQCLNIKPDDPFAESAPQNPTYDWTVRACGNSSNGSSDHCNSTPVFESTNSMVAFHVPLTTDEVADRGLTLSCDDPLPVPANDGGVHVAVTSLEVTLDVRDDHGVLVSTASKLEIGDAPPKIVLPTSLTGTAGAPIDVVATISDVDTPIGQVETAWTAIDPSAGETERDLQVAQPSEPDQRSVAKRLTFANPGTYQVTVTATDPQDPAISAQARDGSPPSAMQTVTITVAPDQPPCIAQWQPIAPPDGTRLPITEPTLFQVPLVHDDLEPYPGLPGGKPFGTTQFAWWIVPPGATSREQLAGATGNRFDVDPAGFTPGDQVELQVEVRDSAHALPACDPADPTCSAQGTDCIQRQTWRLEVR
jgi:hypothetical protein